MTPAAAVDAQISKLEAVMAQYTAAIQAGNNLINRTGLQVDERLRSHVGTELEGLRIARARLDESDAEFGVMMKGMCDGED